MDPEALERFEPIERVFEYISSASAESLARHERVSADIERRKQVTERHTAQLEQNAAQIGELTNLVMRLGVIMTAQAEAQTRTDERLNALVNTVERYIAGRRN